MSEYDFSTRSVAMLIAHCPSKSFHSLSLSLSLSLCVCVCVCVCAGCYSVVRCLLKPWTLMRKDGQGVRGLGLADASSILP